MDKTARRKKEACFRHRTKIRKEVIEKLGGKCVRCGFNDWRALQIDHMNGSGRRKLIKNFGGVGGGARNRFYKSIISGHTKGYQLLCANCNWIKRYEKGENAR